MTTERFIESAETDWTVPRQPPALTLFKIAGVVAASALFLTLLVRVAGRHQRHHSDYNRGFCVTSGWLNRPLDALRFFPRLERLAPFFQR